MSDYDMIRRGDAIAKIKKAASGKSSLGLVLTVDAGVEALREIPAVQVAVKPLEWRECGGTDGVPEWFRAVTIFGVYEVRHVMGRTGYMVYGGSVSPIDRVFGNDTAAKAAAQADYEARIRSAHFAQPSPDVAALVEALQPFSDCADELDYETKETGREYPDDEWAKFRLPVSDYRRARAALARVKGGAK